MSANQFNTIEEAIDDIKNGKIVIVVDDEDRENEGDFIMAGDDITPEAINFMATYGKGLICTPITNAIAEKLDLPLMIQNMTDTHATAFTITIDAAHGATTGISAADRSQTVSLLASDKTVASDFVKPGHIFPLIAKDGGVLAREGHTEAAVDLAVLAGKSPVGVICEILNEDGSCARLPQLIEVAQKFKLKLITIEELIKYRKDLSAADKQVDQSNQGKSDEQHYRG